MKFENAEISNMGNAIRGMRNPLESWERGDSHQFFDYFELGQNDLILAKKLIKGGPEHRKFLRQIFVSVDITAPLYWWKEFDTYKVGTVANSTSTMHKLATTPITIDCFETDSLIAPMERVDEAVMKEIEATWEYAIKNLEFLRQLYLETKNKRYWKEIIKLLPCSWLQTRTITMDYENLLSMYHQRKSHKLTEWHQFCSWIESLPHTKSLFDIKSSPECNHQWTIHHLGTYEQSRECDICKEKQRMTWTILDK